MIADDVLLTAPVVLGIAVGATGFAIAGRRRSTVSVREMCIVAGCDDSWESTARNPGDARAALERLAHDHAERWHPELLGTPAVVAAAGGAHRRTEVARG